MWQAGTGDWVTDWDAPSRLGAARLRAAHRGGRGHHRDHPGRVGRDRAGGGDARAGRRGRRAGGRVHLEPVSAPRRQGARRDASARCRSRRWRTSIGAATTLVAFSLVQMQTGKMADLAAITRGGRAATARGSSIDATQAVPFVPLAGVIDRIDYMVVSGYKHLLSPRGTGYLYVRRDHWDELEPRNANWRAADLPYRPLLRRTVDAGTRRAPVRRLARLVRLDRRRGIAAPPRRVAVDRRVRGRARHGRGPGRAAWACPGTAARSCARSSTTARRPARRARRPASRHRSAARPSASRSTSTTPRPTSTAPRRRSPRSPEADHGGNVMRLRRASSTTRAAKTLRGPGGVGSPSRTPRERPRGVPAARIAARPLTWQSTKSGLPARDASRSAVSTGISLTRQSTKSGLPARDASRARSGPRSC